MPDIVERIIPSHGLSQPEKAQDAVYWTTIVYAISGLTDTLTDENGDDVRLKKGAHVEITVAAEPNTST